MRALNLAMIVICAMPAVAGAQSHYLNIYNTAPSSLVGIATAPAGSRAFREVPLGGKPVQGGGDSTTVAFDGKGGCLRDLRLTFADGRVLMNKDFNVCRDGTYRTGSYWRAAMADPRFTAQK